MQEKHEQQPLPPASTARGHGHGPVAGSGPPASRCRSPGCDARGGSCTPRDSRGVPAVPDWLGSPAPRAPGARGLSSSPGRCRDDNRGDSHQRAPHQRPDPRPRGAAGRSQRRAGRHRPHRGRAASWPQESDLDLVEVAPMARPPVCKLMDYGKFKYESAMKAREARKNQAQHGHQGDEAPAEDRPARLRDQEGSRRAVPQAPATRSRSRSCSAVASSPAPSWASGCCSGSPRTSTELGFVESHPKQDGRNMIMVLGPHKKKAEAKAEAREAQEAAQGGARPTRRRDDATPTRGRRDRGRAAEAATRGASRHRRGRRTPGSRRPDAHACRRLATGRTGDATDEERTAPCRRTRRTAVPRSASGSPAPARSCASRPAGATCSSTSRRTQTRRLAGDVEVAPADAKKIKKLLGK